MPGPLEGKHIVLGVTGSIACYKAIDLASKLTQGGALVDTIMSYGATQFVTPLAFRSIHPFGPLSPTPTTPTPSTALST